MQPAILALVLAIPIALSACTGIRLPAPPEPERDLARIPGMPEDVHFRFWGNLTAEQADAHLQLVAEQIGARIDAEGSPPNGGLYDVLALSGGGPDGAYGAGVLNGWSDRADWPEGVERPEFSLVTGISVGALIAPLALLGPDHDDELKRLFTRTSTSDLVQFNVINAIFGYSLGLTDVRPLENMLDQIVTPALVERIAEEHGKGRRLWIGTTNLDSERPMIWDIGAIAASDYPRKTRLIKQILLASSAIPGAFPPVEFEVEVNGNIYSEMHVDGSVTRQIFVYPGDIPLAPRIESDIPGMKPGTIYLVRNSKLVPSYQPVEPSLLGILERSLFTLTNALAWGDVAAIEQQAAAEGWHIYSSSVPPEFDFPSEDFFDPAYMSALFQVGYDRAIDGLAWSVLHDPDGPENILASGQ